MQVENWPIENVKPYENNPRKNDDAVEYVANSIREFGFQQPLVVDSEGVLIVGHTRLKAAQQLGLTEVPVTVADGLTNEQTKEYRLADNKTAEFAEWDFSMLNEELEGIDWLDCDMGKFGFTLYGEEEFGEEFSVPDGDQPQFKTMTLHFDTQQYEFVSGVLDGITDEETATYSDKVYEVCKLWAMR